MKASSVTFALGGMVFGLVVGWIVGDQQARQAQQTAAAAASVAAVPAQQADTRQAPPVDEQKAAALKGIAEQDPKNIKVRAELANLYFDAERYQDAIGWYEQAFALDTKNPDVSTDLGVSYYYTNDADKALAQFDKSLATDPKHIKTLLNVGIVRAFGKNDLAGAAKAWEEVVAISPDSPEGQAAKKGLEGVKNTAAGTTGK